MSVPVCSKCHIIHWVRRVCYHTYQVEA